jgi:hypothetical protein
MADNVLDITVDPQVGSATYRLGAGMSSPTDFVLSDAAEEIIQLWRVLDQFWLIIMALLVFCEYLNFLYVPFESSLVFSETCSGYSSGYKS